MKRPNLQTRSERGIALVITLVMLAVVTVMAIVFLALSRSERRSVLIYEDLTTANYMSEAALERAKAQAIATIASGGSKLHYDLFSSTNYINPQGFDPSKGASPTNVSYTYANGNPVTGKDLLQVVANLQYDPRPPVFVETNQNGNTDFRYYIDFNRNRVFETNGMLPELDNRGQVILSTNQQGNLFTNFYRFVGDPEWIGVLERPDYPHSESNRFVGRMAYLVLPVGKTLNLNYIHNQSIRSSSDELGISGSANNGFARNHGYGSWELNLAAFFRELNTNNYAWHRLSYFQTPNNLPTGDSFDDARSFLNFRYGGRRSNLSTPQVALAGLNPTLPQLQFETDNIDNFGDDSFTAKTPPELFEPYQDDDELERPWPGAISTNAFNDVQQLFSTDLLSPGFVTRLRNPMHPSRLSSYDRYTFYRLLSQMGADSTPALKGKIHLNYKNPIGQITNNVERWTNAVEFITKAAQLMFEANLSSDVETVASGSETRTFRRFIDMRVSPTFSVTNIQVYSIETNTALMSGDFNNEYTPAVHRMLQVAANIYDNTMNRVRLGAPYFPTVIRPIFKKTATNIVITSFVEVTNATTQVLSLPYFDMADYMTNSLAPGQQVNLYGQHLVVGAKKGHPNFNELSLRTYVEASRKIELRKRSQGALRPEFTNQLFVVNLLNQWGMEAWNSYSNDYPRAVQVHGEVQTSVYIRDAILTNNPIVYSTNYPRIQRNYPLSDWPGRGLSGAFQIVLSTNLHLLQDADYSGQVFTPKNTGVFRAVEPAPRLNLYTTNNVLFYLVSGNRIVDYVSFGRLSTTMDITRSMYSQRSAVNEHVGAGGFDENILWDPTPMGLGANDINVGINNQLLISAGEIPLDDTTWRSFKLSGDKRYGIAMWRNFVGLPRRQGDPLVTATNVAYQTPFVPTRRMHQLLYWQANDPLVHYLAEDIGGIRVSGNVQNLAITQPLPAWNIGNTNRSVIKPSTRPGYHPWGGDPQRAANQQDPYTYNVALQDPGIRTSDDWDFPVGTNEVYNFRSVGELGRVHRGTPWQTIYLKAIHVTDTNDVATLLSTAKTWFGWSGSYGTYPNQDWRFLDLFTTAPNEAAASGLLSVNQTNRAAWAAALGGLLVLTNDFPTASLSGLGDHQGIPKELAYKAQYIQPASPQIEHIVRNINVARLMQTRIIGNTNAAKVATEPYIFAWKTNTPISTNIVTHFEHLGDILYAPGLTLQSPYLNTHREQVQHVLTDEAIEYIPQRILGLLQRDEPRFVVYAFGQSLKPAPGAMNTSADYYGLVTNYQITGEVITKTVFRVEGEVPYYDNNGTLLNPGNPLRAVVESYNVLPPPE